ncbi:MAG: helix-turn-helix domain-containing protein [Rhodopseudomonas sp.]|nr:helix-turn-helix domain-containing protein [Rhodopseudomonas sp.]
MKNLATFSTDTLPAQDRFAHWREVRAEKIYGVTIELAAEKRRQFQGRFSSLSIGNSALVEMHASSYSVHRSPRAIANAPSDSLCIYQQINAAAWFDAGKGRDFIVSAGNLAVSHSDLPYQSIPTTEAGFHLRLVKIPFSYCQPLIEKAADLTPRPVAKVPGLSSMLCAYYDAFVAQVPTFDDDAAEAAVTTLAQLALLTRGLADPGAEPSRAAIHAAQLQVAFRMIDANMHRANLSASAMAAMLGISVRQLHLLFEPTGTSYARYVQGRRLERARTMLTQHGGQSVLNIALACGFDSLSTFYRVFRAAHGVPPGDYRHAMRADA